MAKTTTIAGNTFLFTGKLTEFTREDAEAHVEAEGGKVLSGVSAKLNYLVVGEDAGSKLKKAESLGSVTILHEKEFLKMMSSGKKAPASKKNSKSNINIAAIEEVKIGNQIWMAKNMDVTNFNDGTPITRAKNPKEFEDLGESKIPAYIIYENKVSNRNDYGLLYNHYAVASEHGLAPIGYNVPTVEDFGILIGRFGIHDKASKVLISVNGKKSKSGFDALLGGCIHYGRYDGINQDAKFWTISLWDANNKKQPAKEAFYEVFNNGIGITETNSRPFSFGFSVRCIKNVFGNPKTPAKTVTKVVKSKK